MEIKQCKLLIAATGSVASLKIPLLIKSILETTQSKNTNFEVRLVVTAHAKHFFAATELPSNLVSYDDESEWQTWKQRGDPVLHVELGKWADMMVIAPLDANTLAKMAQGICNNLVTCIVRAWDMTKPLIFCPAMNTKMWNHPITTEHIAKLKSWGHIEVPPINKLLVCGDTGVGAMAEVDTILEIIIQRAEILSQHAPDSIV